MNHENDSTGNKFKRFIKGEHEAQASIDQEMEGVESRASEQERKKTSRKPFPSKSFSGRSSRAQGGNQQDNSTFIYMGGCGPVHTDSSPKESSFPSQDAHVPADAGEGSRSILGAIGDVFSSIGRGIGDALSSIGSGIGDFFDGLGGGDGGGGDTSGCGSSCGSGCGS